MKPVPNPTKTLLSTREFDQDALKNHSGPFIPNSAKTDLQYHHSVQIS